MNRRIITTERGGPETLRLVEEDVPEPEAGEVRIRVDTAGVLLGDVFWQKGLIPGGPSPPFTPGYDAIGTVDALGAGADAPDAGQRVAVLTEFGSYADYVVVPADWTVPVPNDMDPVILSALVMSYLTAYQILHHVASVSFGDQALIHGGAGSTGSAFLDLGQTMNLQMWGTASKPKHEIVERYGARPIDYRSVDFVKRMREEAPDGVDVVVDPIGGRHLDRSWRVVNGRGALVATAAIGALQGASTVSTVLGMAKLWVRNKLPNGRTATFFNMIDYNRMHPKAFGRDLNVLIEHQRADRISPVIAAEFPLEDAADAQKLLIDSRARGRVVLRCST